MFFQFFLMFILNTRCRCGYWAEKVFRIHPLTSMSLNNSMHMQWGRLSFSQGIKYHDLSCLLAYLLTSFEFSFLFHEMDCTLYVIVYFSKCQSLHIDFCWWTHTRIAHIIFFPRSTWFLFCLYFSDAENREWEKSMHIYKRFAWHHPCNGNAFSCEKCNV